jgi:3-phosphoshikimate 1-carboxyvinyltransferase
MRGDVSSQFITGMIFALSTLGKDSRIIITTPIESRSYIDLTLSSLEKMGVEARFEDDGSIFIRGGQRYSPIDYTVEGDYSSAAFMDALNCFGGRVEIDGLNDSGRQGDRVYKEHFSALLREFSEIDLTDCPDLGPILFTVAAAKHGGRFTGTKRLRDKESDRIEAMKEELEKFGARLVAEDNSVVINPCPLHSPSEPLYGHNDHRIVMSLAVLCTVYGGEIEGAEAISKSYTSFFEDLKKLGIAIYEFE